MRDIDASDAPLHGEQERSQFHGYNDHHCYLSLYVFCRQAMQAFQLLLKRLRPAKLFAPAPLKIAVLLTNSIAECPVNPCEKNDDDAES